MKKIKLDMKDSEVELSQLQGALNESSKFNQQFFFLFLIFIIYILITVLSTTDIQLLLPETNVQLPIINIGLSLFGFFIVAPLLVVILHSFLLFNFLQHNKKLFKWSSSSDNLLTYPFLLNFLCKSKNDDNHHFILKFLSYSTILLPPLFLVLLIQIKFSAYHSFVITLEHFILFMIDVSIIIIYGFRIINIELSSTEYNGFKKMLIHHFNSNFFCILFNTIFKKKLKTKEFLFGVLQSINHFIIWLFFIYSIINLTVSTMLFLDYTANFYRFFPVVPHLCIQKSTLVKSQPDEETIFRYIQTGKTRNEIRFEMIKGVNLEGRDLRFADFSQSDLTNANLRMARLDGARMWYTILQGADLTNSFMKGAYLGFADLNRAIAVRAIFTGSDFSYANLKSIDLQETNLIGANFSSGIESSDYKGHLQGADLAFTDLRGSNLFDAQLQGAILDNANMQGVKLGMANLQGATLREAELQGADFSNANLQGTDFSNAYINCALFGNANISGLIFTKLDTITKLNWKQHLMVLKILIPEVCRGHSFDDIFNPRFARDESLNNSEEISDNCWNRYLFNSSNINSNYVYGEFLIKKEEIVCEDIDVADGMFKQLFMDESIFASDATQRIRQLIANYMKVNCPEKLKQIKSRGDIFSVDYGNN